MGSLQSVNSTAQRWVRARVVFPLIVITGLILFVISEATYRRTTTTLQGGVALTNARIKSLQLVQLLSDANAAQFAFSVSGEQESFDTLEQAVAQIPSLQSEVTTYFGALDEISLSAVVQLDEALDVRLGSFRATLGAGREQPRLQGTPREIQVESSENLRLLRSRLSALLAQATEMQNRARSSIYDALEVNRVAVGSLSLVAVLTMLLFLRQLQIRDRERSSQRFALEAERQRLEREVQRRTSELSDLTVHLQTVREDERAYLARELHDELGALLTAGKLEIARARRKVAEQPDVLERLDKVSEHLNSGIALKRRIIEDLRPSSLSNLGLIAALDTLCREMSERLGTPIDFVPTELGLGAQGDLAVYRFVQEALTNASKYAEARRIEVSLGLAEGRCWVTVGDDGVGFDPARALAGHHGLSGMRFRAESLGGKLAVHSVPGSGTAVSIELPVQGNASRQRPDSRMLVDQH